MAGYYNFPKRLRYPQQSQKEEVVCCQNSFHNFNIHKSMLLDTGNQSSVQKKKSILIEADGGFTVKLSERWQLLHQRGNLGNKWAQIHICNPNPIRAEGWLPV